MHWDSDIDGAALVMPICSVVVFLSAGVGGPTLVTDQRIEEAHATKNGWLVFPDVVGRLVAFDGTVLHQVVGGAPPHRDGRRTTLMFAFWPGEVPKIRPRGPGEAAVGAFRPLPQSPRWSFVKELAWSDASAPRRCFCPSCRAECGALGRVFYGSAWDEHTAPVPVEVAPVFRSPVFVPCAGTSVEMPPWDYWSTFHGNLPAYRDAVKYACRRNVESNTSTCSDATADLQHDAGVTSSRANRKRSE